MSDASIHDRGGYTGEPPYPYNSAADFEPDPARSYERATPYKEYGHDALDLPQARPCHAPDRMIRAVHNAHESHHSDSALNAGDFCPLE